MNNVIVGNHIVYSAVNPATRILVYTVHDLADGVKVSEPGKEIVAQSFQSATLFPGVDVYNDVLYQIQKGMPPDEVVVMPLHVTIGELKRAAESALRDTYCITERFAVMGIEGLDEMDDKEVFFGVTESGVEVGVAAGINYCFI